MIARSCFATVVAALALCGGPLSAQEPAVRAQLDSLRDRIQAFTDSSMLLSREGERIDYARGHRDDPMIHMELGWTAFRIGELTGGKKHYDDAASEFQWAAELRPAWAYAWYWLGASQLAQGETGPIVVENLRQVFGVDYLSSAARSFARAIEIDPSFTQALVDLASTALRQRVRGRVAVALQALRNAAATPAGRQPLLWLMRGRLERRLGESDSSLAAFRRFVDLGGDHGVGHVEVARALAAVGRGDSALTAYDTALAVRPSDVARLEIRRDIKWVSGGAELARFDALPAESVGAWVRRFWSAREVEDARRPGERLLEQFRRYAFVAQHFALVSRRRAFSTLFPFRDTTQTEVDDRGVIYMRHGEPQRRVRFTPAGDGSEPNESWLYRREPPESDLIFHFAAIGDVQDFRLVESLARVCLRGMVSTDAVDIAAIGTIDPVCIGARAEFSELYQRMERQGQFAEGFRNLLASEREMVRRDVRTGTTSDSYRITFRGELRPVISTFVVGDTAKRPELHVVFAVPGARLHGQRVMGGVSYPLLLRVIVYDSARREIASLDTVRTFRAAEELSGGSYLTEQLVLRVPPGAWRLHVVVEEVQSGFGGIVRGHDFTAPRLDRGFEVSDVVVGRENSGLVWRKPEGEVPLNPLARFPAGGAALLYYEIYGLPQSANVATRVTLRSAGSRSIVRRLFGGGRSVDISYTTVTDAPGRARVTQRLDLADLAAGAYVLTVELTDPVSGRRLIRDGRFEIVGRAP